MGVAQDFAEYVKSLTFKSPTATLDPYTNSKINTWAEAFTQNGIFQQASGRLVSGPNGVEICTINDVYIDPNINTTDMYHKIRSHKERWHVLYDGIEYLITSIEAPGELSDPYIMELEQVVT